MPYNERIANIEIINNNYEKWITEHQNIGNDNQQNSIQQLFGIPEMIKNRTIINDKDLSKDLSKDDFDKEHEKFLKWQQQRKSVKPSTIKT